MKPDLLIKDAPVPAVHRHRKRRSRTIRDSAVGVAAQALGEISTGCEIFGFTNGQFSIVDILDHCLNATGPADVDIATWTASDGDLRRAHAFLLNRRIRQCRFVVDPSFRSRKPEFCNVLVSLFGNDAIRTTPLHGKFSTVVNDRWSLAIRSSMNLNVNRRIETVEISDDPALARFLKEWTDSVFERSPAGNFTSQSSQLNARQTTKSRLTF